MKQRITLIMAAMLITGGSVFGQQITTNGANDEPTKKTPAATKKAPSQTLAKAVTALGIVTNGYVAGSTHNLFFSVLANNTDEEFIDSLSLTFPAGMTINDVSNAPEFGASNPNTVPELFNGVDGQVISWGDNDNSFGGISTGQVYNFTVNVTFDGSLTGDQTIAAFASGDMFGDAPADDSFDITVSETANEARLQVIHNSADLAAATVDVRVNGDFPDASFDDLSFRTASPFITVPATTALGLTVNDPGSADDGSPLFSQAVTLDPGQTYIVVASGIVSSAGYDPLTPFSLEVYAPAFEESGDDESTFVLVHHGSTDAGTIDVLAPGLAATIVDDFSYPEFAGYFDLGVDNYVLQITDPDQTTVIASYEANLADLGLGGSAITVLASGFLDPAVNSDGASFGLWVALPEGGALVELGAATAPENDSPCNALPLTDAVTTTSSNSSATVDAEEPVPTRGACTGITTWCD